MCKAAVSGYYEGDYFNNVRDRDFSISCPVPSRRLRAVVRYMNQTFVDHHRQKGYKFHIEWFEDQEKLESDEADDEIDGETEDPSDEMTDPGEESQEQKAPDSQSMDLNSPQRMSNKEALDWVSKVMLRTRGRELAGNFNPRVIGELFWEQSSKWQRFAMAHIDQVADACRLFLADLLKEKSASDIYSRIWSQIQNDLKLRYKGATDEPKRNMEDIKSYPVNYNHYYTDIIKSRRRMREKGELAECIEAATRYDHLSGCQSDHTSASVDVDMAMRLFSQRTDPDMEKHSCEEVLDCLYAIYKVRPAI